MSETLNELVLRYLKENGIKNIFFSKCIEEDNAIVSKWLNGKGTIPKSRLYKVHDFLNGKFLKTIADIVNEKEER